MKFTIITGLSGAGRSSTLKRLEDLGHYCVDNLMPQLIPDFARLANEQGLDSVAVAVDMRTGGFFDAIYATIDTLKAMNLDLNILFLDANDQTLIRRFKESRRRHPISGSGEIISGIRAERLKLQQLKDISTRVIDTSESSAMDLKRLIDELYSTPDDYRLKVTIISFGYKRGIPLDADMVFDMRFVKNPFYVEGMRSKTGLEREVSNFVLSFPETQYFLKSLVELVGTLADSYMREDKKQLVIGIGCTGGMHRSVAVSEELKNRLSQNPNLNVGIEHRDLKLEKNFQT